MVYNVVRVSGLQQSESVLHINISILFFPCRSLQTIEQDFLCYRAGSHESSAVHDSVDSSLPAVVLPAVTIRLVLKSMSLFMGFVCLFRDAYGSFQARVQSEL